MPASLQLVEEQLKGTSELASFMAGLSQEIKVCTGAPCWLVLTAPPPPPAVVVGPGQAVQDLAGECADAASRDTGH